MTAFDRQPLFIKALRNGQVEGLLALAWIEEEGYFGHFPGETWNAKTWIEQNRIVASSPPVATELLAAVPGPFHLRYLKRSSMISSESQEPDEINYSMRPAQYDCSFANYLEQFGGKTRKKLLSEVDKFKKSELTFRFDHLPDIEAMFKLNLKAFGTTSYFYDQRFLKAFERLAAWLSEEKLLRVTTILIKGKIAAIDMSAVWRNCGMVLAGGTNPDFPGIAKLINLHHIERACNEKLETVDFLCGDFNWKERFHLHRQQLYKLYDPQISASPSGILEKTKIRNDEKKHG